VLHDAFVRWGFPDAILADRGSQFTAHQLHGGARVLGPSRRLGTGETLRMECGREEIARHQIKTDCLKGLPPRQ